MKYSVHHDIKSSPEEYTFTNFTWQHDQVQGNQNYIFISFNQLNGLYKFI